MQLLSNEHIILQSKDSKHIFNEANALTHCHQDGYCIDFQILLCLWFIKKELLAAQQDWIHNKGSVVNLIYFINDESMIWFLYNGEAFILVLQEGSMNRNAFDPIAQHRDWCPWVCPSREEEVLPPKKGSLPEGCEAERPQPGWKAALNLFLSMKHSLTPVGASPSQVSQPQKYTT